MGTRERFYYRTSLVGMTIDGMTVVIQPLKSLQVPSCTPWAWGPHAMRRGDPSEIEDPSISHLNVLVAPDAIFRAEWSSNIDCVVLVEVQEVLLTLRDGYRPRAREIGAYR